MTKAEKLWDKLDSNKISALELRTLFQSKGAFLVRTKGSHEVWKLEDRILILATHSKELKYYQMKQAKEFLSGTQKKFKD